MRESKPPIQSQGPARPALAAALFAALLSVGCGDAAEERSRDAASGLSLYETPVGGLACADCHGESAEPVDAAAAALPGRPLAGVAARPSLWGGRFEGDGALRDAVRFCAARFQYRMEEALGSGGDRMLELVPLEGAALDAIAAYVAGFDGPADAVPLERDDDLDDATELPGDPQRGAEVWLRACAVCHGDEAEGGLGPRLDGNRAPDPFTLAEYVREGAPVDHPREWMPWFRTDELTTQELADLIAAWAGE